MKYYFKTIYPLVVIAVFFGAILGVTYHFLSPLIEATRVREENKALKSVFAKGETFTVMTNKERIYYKVEDTSKKVIGYIFKNGAVGYGGPISTLVGINMERKVERIFILSADNETPGLGYKCTDPTWQKQFTNLSAAQVPMDKAGFTKNNLEAITAATISSKAVTKNIKLSFDMNKELNLIPEAMMDTNTNTNGEATNG